MSWFNFAAITGEEGASAPKHFGIHGKINWIQKIVVLDEKIELV